MTLGIGEAQSFSQDMFSQDMRFRHVATVTSDPDPLPKVTVGGLPMAAIDGSSLAHSMIEAALARRAS